MSDKSESNAAQEQPLYIKVHDSDNVAIVVNNNGLRAGTRFNDDLELIEHVPQGHKVALVDIAKSGAIIRYGEIIGMRCVILPKEAGSMNRWSSCHRLPR